MFFYENFLCPVCREPLNENDDVVACPVCGAPHHRACWQQNGRCFFEAVHGTSEQWSRETGERADAAKETPESVRCPQCGTENAPEALYCEHCGVPLAEEDDEYDVGYDEPQQDFRRAYEEQYGAFAFRGPSPTGGVPAEEPIDGVPAGDLAAAAGPRSHYYIPRFKRIAEGKKVSWNWSAFLFPQYWLFYRKQYVWGAVTTLVDLLFSVASLLLVMPYMPEDPADLAALYEAIEQMGTARLLAVDLVGLLIPVFHVLFGLFGNALYENILTRRVAAYREKHPLYYPEELLRLGGVSLISVLIAYLTIQLIGSIVLPYLFA